MEAADRDERCDDDARLPTRRAEAVAKRELECFYGAWLGRVPEEGAAPDSARRAATSIEAWPASLVTYDRGALRLRYTPRTWPRELVEVYGPWTSLVVRLDCAVRPWDGMRSTEELEAASVVRLLAARGSFEPSGGIRGLPKRARRWERDARRAYLAVRGESPCVLPVDPTLAEEGEAAQ